MSEYIERDAAFDAVFGQFCASSDETEAALNAAIEEIRAIPAADVRSTEYCEECRAALLETIDRYKQLCADVRPVVLCRDCKHSAIDLENMRYCKCVTYYNHVQDDWFCADGEKKEES